MHYYSIRFRVQKENGIHFWFISGNLWKSKENAVEYAKGFASKCAEDDETIDYELEKLVVVEP